MIRKSAWLLSAGAVRRCDSGVRPDTPLPAPIPTSRPAQPTPGATPKRAAVQDQAREQQPVDTGDIVITATRRNQALSDVPMAVSAVTAAARCEYPARPTSGS